MIYKVENYVSDEGAQLRVMTPENELKEIKYVGTAQIGTPDGKAFPIQFEIPNVKTVTEAFEGFKKCAELELEKLEKEMSEANRLIDAQGNPIGSPKGSKEPLLFPGNLKT